MEHANKYNIGDTIRIRRPPKVFTDTLGRTSWMSGIEPLHLELKTDANINTNPYNRSLSPVSQA